VGEFPTWLGKLPVFRCHENVVANTEIFLSPMSIRLPDL
jgi:hypothetical protein